MSNKCTRDILSDLVSPSSLNLLRSEVIGDSLRKDVRMYPQLAIRERFNIDQKNYSMASRLIKDAIKEAAIKEADTESNSKKYAKYLPYWA